MKTLIPRRSYCKGSDYYERLSRIMGTLNLDSYIEEIYDSLIEKGFPIYQCFDTNIRNQN